MLDDLAGALIGGVIGDAIAVSAARRRARRKASRFLVGETIAVRAYLRREEQDQFPRRGRIRLTPGSAVSPWAPWPRWGRQALDVLLIGGRGYPEVIKLGWWHGEPAGHAWRVRIGETEVATILIERNYASAFAPALSLGAVPPPQSRRRGTLMGRIVAVTSVLVGATLLAGCTGSASVEMDAVPIASVVAGPGGIGVVPDDGRGCPTTFAVHSEESDSEIRLTLTSSRADGSTSCVAVPVASLGAPVGGRSIVDTTSSRRFTLPADVGGPGAGVSLR